MIGNKTVPNETKPTDFLNGIDNPVRKTDALRLLNLFQDVTGYQPVMWGESIVGFGRYHYVYQSGREGDFLATGFSPRKANLSIYIMPGYKDYSTILSRLGKHKLGKSCLYVNKLADIDQQVLAELICAGLRDLDAKWPVQPF